MYRKISVVIPTYNRGKENMRELISCLRNQSLARHHFEVLIIDDGSDVPIRIEDIHSEDVDIRLLTQRHGGSAKAKNRGVLDSRFDIILFLDDDSRPLKPCLEKYLNLHNKEEKIAVLGMSHLPKEYFLPDVRKYFPNYHGFLRVQKKMLNIRDMQTLGWQDFITCNLSVKKYYLVDNLFNEEIFKTAHCEDIELGYRLMTKAGIHLRFSKEAAVYHPHYLSFEEKCEWAVTNGMAKAAMAMLHPEIKDYLFYYNHYQSKFDSPCKNINMKDLKKEKEKIKAMETLLRKCPNDSELRATFDSLAVWMYRVYEYQGIEKYFGSR